MTPADEAGREPEVEPTDHERHDAGEHVEDGERPIERPEEGSEERPDEGLDVLAILEAMLFASPEPLRVEEIAAAMPEMEPEEIAASLDRLGAALARPSRGLRLERAAGGFRLTTSPELAAPLRALFRFRNRKRLTPATLDVLAIVAYAQPITGPEIQEIRGADPAYALKALQERKLIRMVGRKRVVGRPIVYGTTQEFLLHFGLDSLEDLPPVEGYGTHVVPAQGRLFPVTEDAGRVDIDPDLESAEPVPDEGEPASSEQDAEQDVDEGVEQPASVEPDDGEAGDAAGRGTRHDGA
jgi:segregation and condensation protein B